MEKQDLTNKADFMVASEICPLQKCQALVLAVVCPLDSLGEYGIYFLLLCWNMREREKSH